jgi:predicted metalloprotease with PDZ domain
VTQADRLYGARHFDHYNFLMAMTDRLGGIGLEHHRSSEDSVDPAFFTDWDNQFGDRDLLAHEYTHSWNGKWRRPAGQYVPNYNTPLQNELLWVYEGQTQFWGKVLAARSGLMTKDQALDALAMDAATYDNRVGRQWRAMQDTVNDPIISMRRPKGWLSEQRDEDYYVEGQLIWLDADTLIREKTNGRKGLDDFAKAFFGTHDGEFNEAPYTFDDVVAALNGVSRTTGRPSCAPVWTGTAKVLREWAPLDGLTRGGYRLVYTDTKSPWQKTLEGGLKRNNFMYSIGLQTNGENGITAVQWDGPAFKAGLTIGMSIVAVNGEAASASNLTDAIKAAKGTDAMIELIVKDGDRYRTVSLDYHDGLRYPHLERIPGTPDRLSDLYAARTR